MATPAAPSPAVAAADADPVDVYVQKMLNPVTARFYELELRVGTRSARCFKPAVPKALLNAVIADLTSDPDFASRGTDTTEWTESHDFFYPLRDSVVRTTVSFNDTNFEMHTEHVIKEKVALQDAAHYRVSCAHERVVLPEQLPFSSHVAHMRIKQRRSICVREPEMTHPLWRYDFTLVWSGKDKREAELAQQSVPPQYELEVEVLAPGAQELLRLLRNLVGHAHHAADAAKFLRTRIAEIGSELARKLHQEAGNLP
jgi:hypothetical protein